MEQVNRGQKMSDLGYAYEGACSGKIGGIIFLSISCFYAGLGAKLITKYIYRNKNLRVYCGTALVSIKVSHSITFGGKSRELSLGETFLAIFCPFAPNLS